MLQKIMWRHKFEEDSYAIFAHHHVLDPRVKTLPCTDEPPLDLPVLLAPNVEALAPPNTLSQQLSTSVLEGLLPDIAVTHLMNLVFEPELVLLLLPVVDVSFLVLLVPVGSEPLFVANAEVIILLLDAAIKDTAITIAIIANDVVITFFLYIELTMYYLLKIGCLTKLVVLIWSMCLA
jgi:hypothetical protein